MNRRSFFGLTAGATAAGLLGWFGRMRFRPQRRLEVGEWFEFSTGAGGDAKNLALYVEAGVVRAFYGGPEGQELYLVRPVSQGPPEPFGWQSFVGFCDYPEARHVVEIKVRALPNGTPIVDFYRVAIIDPAHDKEFPLVAEDQIAAWQPSTIDDAGKFTPLDFLTHKSLAKWRAIA